ncbi:glycosyltransferase family 4 protein [bacterium]|nr:glycosyltransferase family 4 protein [bacterium]
MKILMINKFFFVKGGAERYFFELKSILESRGHQVIPFSMAHPRNFSDPYSRYFVDEIDFNAGSLSGRIRAALISPGRVLYSHQAQQRIRALISETRPDIAHLHMIDHQISPSILPVLSKAGIPVVQTVHTYKHVCPSYRLYHMKQCTICEKCVGGGYYRAVLEKCHRGSFYASLLLAMEMTLHRKMRLFEKYVDLFIPPSHFMAAMLVRGGYDPGKIEHLFYTIQIDAFPCGRPVEPYFVFYGRLSEEKGLLTLLEAMKGIEKGMLKIIGEGPMKEPLIRFIRSNRLEGRVQLTGVMGGQELKEAVARSQFVVVPSEWYENSPLVIYESFAMGKPVIGASIGGIPELIEPGISGALFPAGDAGALRERIRDFLDHPEKMHKFGKAARKRAETLFDPAVHYDRIMELYERQILTKKRSLQ